MEIWKRIEGYQNYMVSNIGNIKNTKLNIQKSLRKTKTGYLIVDLKENGIKQTKYVHRLVATAFILNENNLSQVNHKDENKSNNFVENLEWCSIAYNNTYNGRAKRVGEKLKICQPNRKRVKNIDTGTIYDSVRAAGRALNISGVGISYCLNGKQKTAAGYRWEVV